MIDGFIVNVGAIAIKRAACAETGRIAAQRVLAWLEAMLVGFKA
jgi:hypothetical protein